MLAVSNVVCYSIDVRRRPRGSRRGGQFMPDLVAEQADVGALSLASDMTSQPRPQLERSIDQRRTDWEETWHKMGEKGAVFRKAFDEHWDNNPESRGEHPTMTQTRKEWREASLDAYFAGSGYLDARLESQNHDDLGSTDHAALREEWLEAQEEVTRTVHAYSAVMDGALASGDTSADNPKIAEARRAALESTEKEFLLRKESLRRKPAEDQLTV